MFKHDRAPRQSFTSRKISSKLSLSTPERLSTVFIGNFEHIS